MLQPRAAMIRRTPIVYGVLAAAWALIVVWQIAADDFDSASNDR